jgi:protein TonB
VTDIINTSSIPQALSSPLGDRPSYTLPLAILVAFGLHLLLILTVSFRMPEPRRYTPSDQALEVLLLKEGGETTRHPAPDATLSQRNRAGESPQGREAIAPPVDRTPRPEASTQPDATPPENTPKGATNHRSLPPTPTRPRDAQPDRLILPPKPAPLTDEPTPPQPPPPPVAAPVRAVDAAQILASRDQEINRLTESLQARTSAYASRLRRKSISASTREFRYASYLGAWERKVERIGNLNYPQAAKTQKLQGNLILDVAVRADGHVEQVRVVRSSGQPLLDEAAIKIVHLAAPYAPFPPDIAAETDVLNILRTWQFLSGGSLGWEDQRGE